MSEGPERHPDIPAGAAWRVDLEKWEVVALDAVGARQGESRLFRPDGSLYMRSQFVAGVQDGPFTLFHPDGQLARQGRYQRGELDGDVIARVAAAGEGEPLRSCCVPEPAVELRARFAAGDLVYERFYDQQGRLLLSDGGLCPDRPPALPESADYDEGSGRWMVSAEPGASDQLARFYRQDGTLDEEARFEAGWKTLSRVFATDGSVMTEIHSGRDGRKNGRFLRRFHDPDRNAAGDANGEPSPYLDARIVEERGTYAADQPSGRWTFHDRSGAIVRTVEHGPGPKTPPTPTPSGAPDTSGVFADETRPAPAWAALAQELAAGAQVGLGACAAARAAARAGDPGELVAFLAQHTVALAPAHAQERSQKVVEQASEAARSPEADVQGPLLSALVAGADPAELIRCLSGLHRTAPRAALDLAEAALLLAPDRPTGFLTRALARIELGDDRGALVDAARLQEISAESADFLRDYARVLYPAWAFWPAQEQWGPTDGIDGVPEQPAQPLDAIVRVLQVYATRLLSLRAAVLARAPHRDRAAWLPPALTDLLPEGPVQLARWEATITDETDQGPETVAVVIDETLDCAGQSLPELMRQARAQWAALTWLAWAVGLPKLALPAEIEAPAGFAPAAVAAITRCYRLEDTLATGGLRSRTAGIPGFLWHGIDVDQLSRPVAEVALHETRELRPLFLWLLSPENHSPFQSDLRE